MYDYDEIVNYLLSQDVLPWYNDDLIAFLTNIDLKGKRIFEYGSGASTVYYLQRGAKLFSIETKKHWYDAVLFVANEKNLSSNLTIKLCDDIKNFPYEIKNPAKQNLTESCKFDIIVIDSRDRAKCAIEALNHIKSGGMIIWDNSERENALKAIEEIKMKAKGFKYFQSMGINREGESQAVVFFF